MSLTITRGEQVTVGRRDYGWGVTGTQVDVGGEPFIEVRGTLYVACGDCSPAFSGTKTYHLGVLGGVCFQCNGHGVTSALGSEADAVRIVKRRIADRARRARKAAERETAAKAAAAAWSESNPEAAAIAAEVLADFPERTEDQHADLTEVIAWEERWGGFVTSLAQRSQWAPLSEKQTAALVEAATDAKAAYAADQARVAVQRYHGAEGDKVAIPGRVAVAMNVESTSYTGFPETKRLVVVEGTGDYVGVTVKVVGVGKTLWEAERDTDVVISGTVKDHSEYQGTKQTVLTRAKVVAA